MARSRRSYRRSTSQQAVGLLTVFLPAPIQKIADTRFGSSLILIGIPALIIAGVLQLKWDGGAPHLTIDRERATELRNAARDEIGRISSSDSIQQWQNSANELWNATQAQVPYASSSAAQYASANPNPQGTTPANAFSNSTNSYQQLPQPQPYYQQLAQPPYYQQPAQQNYPTQQQTYSPPNSQWHR